MMKKELNELEEAQEVKKYLDLLKATIKKKHKLENARPWWQTLNLDKKHSCPSMKDYRCN